MRPTPRFGIATLLLAALLAAPASAASIPPDGLSALPVDPGVGSQVEHLLPEELSPIAELLPPEGDDTAPPADSPPEAKDPDFAARVRAAFEDELLAAGLAGLAAATLGAVGFALVTRYVSPKEALKNPQRAMLYGFIRATPGAHLKQLSEEFAMKTSSILWHIRKLEAAELVHSDRVNGFRVFYPVEGGIEVKRVSRAITALQNDNAKHIFERIQRNPGASTRQISEALGLHGGTARWHLRKLREHGLLEELVRDDGSRFYNTPLGDRAIETMLGRPVDSARPAPRRSTVPLPVPE